MVTILIFFAVLSLLVFVHELGHFLAAKWAGVKVEEFGFGLPPRVLGKKIGQTLYSINLLPIGGFVKLLGEDGEFATIGDPKSFSVKSPKKRALILLAGVVGNLILATFIFTFLFNVGLPVFMEKPMFIEVDAGGIADLAGLKQWDKIIKMDDTKIDYHWDASDYIRAHTGKEIKMVVKREETKLSFKVTPKPLLGVTISNLKDLKEVWWKTPYYGILETGKTLVQMATGIASLIYSLFGGEKIATEVTGPIGIADMTRFFAELGYRYLLQFVALLSVNLAFMNVLPFPALDGGRLIFVAYELITKKKAKAGIEARVTQVGFAILIAFMLWITVKDVLRMGWLG